MPKYEHRQHILSDWLAELDQRFQLGEVEDTNKITWCQILIGATGSSVISSLEEEATWEDAKETLLTHLGIGSVRNEAWAALKNLKKGSKDIVGLAGEAEKLTEKLHPRDEEASKRHAVDTSSGALDRTLAAEVQKLGHKTMEDVVAAASRIEKILDEQTDTKIERLVSTMQEQIRLLEKDLKEVSEQIAAHRTTAPPVAAMAAVPAPTAATAAAAQPPPAAPQPQQPLQPLNRLLPRPPATSTRITVKSLPSIALPVVKWIAARHVASSAAKKATSCPTVLPAQSFNTSSASKHTPAPAPRLEDKYWSCQPPRTTPTPILTCI